MSKWSIPIDQLAERATAKMEDVARSITIQLFSDVIFKSPVGNPDLWKSKPPKGYVGGRFRANWNVTYGSPDTSFTESVDRNRGAIQAQLAATLPVGGITYLSNGLPYAYRLEYGSWSSQVPLGMVRTSVAAIDQHVRKALTK